MASKKRPPHSPAAPPPRRAAWHPAGNPDPRGAQVIPTAAEAGEILREIGGGLVTGDDRVRFIGAWAVRSACLGHRRGRRRAILLGLNQRRCEPPLATWIVDALELFNAPFGSEESAECHG